MLDYDPSATFPELLPDLPVIHLALVNVSTGTYIYHKQTTNESHAAWLKESYDQQATAEEPGFTFYKGQQTPQEYIDAEQLKLTETPSTP